MLLQGEPLRGASRVSVLRAATKYSPLGGLTGAKSKAGRPSFAEVLYQDHRTKPLKLKPPKNPTVWLGCATWTYQSSVKRVSSTPERVPAAACPLEGAAGRPAASGGHPRPSAFASTPSPRQLSRPCCRRPPATLSPPRHNIITFRPRASPQRFTFALAAKCPSHHPSPALRRLSHRHRHAACTRSPLYRRLEWHCHSRRAVADPRWGWLPHVGVLWMGP